MIVRLLRLLAVVALASLPAVGMPAGAAEPGTMPTPAAFGPDAVALRVMTFNVLNSNRDYGRFSAFVEETRPDIVLLQEARPHWIERTVLADYPHTISAGTGLVVASRFPFVADPGNTRPGNRGAGRALRVLVDVGAPEPVAVYALHPSSPRQKNGMAIQAEDYRRLGELIAAEPADRPVIGGGDFNTVPGSPVFRRFADRTGVRVLAGETIGTPTRFARELGMPTWLGVAIDHVIGRGAVAFTGRTVGPDLGSDHLPVVVDVVVN